MAKTRRAKIRRTDITVEQWLKSEGILKEPLRPPRTKRQYKSLIGQQSLIERDGDGKPTALRKPEKKPK